MIVTLYSTGCPKCTVLEKKLNQSGVDYSIITDVDLMQEKGLMSLPVLEIDGEMKDFKDAVTWVNEIGTGVSNG